MAQCKCHAAAFNKGMFRLLDCAVQCEFCVPSSQSYFNLPHPHSRTHITPRRALQLYYIFRVISPRRRGSTFSELHSHLAEGCTPGPTAGTKNRKKLPTGPALRVLLLHSHYSSSLESQKESPIGKRVLKALS